MIWYVLKSSDGGFIAYQFGIATDYTAPGDYDGDGKFDYAVQRPGATPAAAKRFSKSDVDAAISAGASKEAVAARIKSMGMNPKDYGL